MIDRNLHSSLIKRLSTSPVVVLLGSRQVGKTTLARSLELEKPCHYLDLERPSDLAKLADPELYLGKFSDHLIILDEIQRVPDLFPVLRSLVDERRRAGEKSAQFLLLGSASPELLQQSSETLAGRISYLELHPLHLTELDPDPDRATREQHWFRGGYPDSYLADDDDTAMQWSADFITSYVERYLPQLGVRSTPLQLRRFCTMLAHQQGSTLNLSKIGGSLGIDAKTVRHYLDLLEGLYLMRTLPAWSNNAGKRLVKAPKTYWRDTGLLHSLAGLTDMENLLGHPLCGHSWEGYCMEQILTRLPAGTLASHYRTQAGAEIDLVLEHPNGDIHAIEIKRTLSPKLTPSFLESMKTLGATQGTYLIPEGETYPLSDSINAISLPNFFMRS
ncbi:MAG: ATP-binding protein [Verrucomicrobiae bacterium]|nr:ATP-binding protein [Verrucomicrobiae bacterium]NNJ42291.1 ATP-binding protein [Akkermansiaceae bacterium]